MPSSNDSVRSALDSAPNSVRNGSESKKSDVFSRTLSAIMLHTAGNQQRNNGDSNKVDNNSKALPALLALFILCLFSQSKTTCTGRKKANEDWAQCCRNVNAPSQCHKYCKHGAIGQQTV